LAELTLAFAAGCAGELDFCGGVSASGAAVFGLEQLAMAKTKQNVRVVK
jgi:hypothetical protein